MKTIIVKKISSDRYRVSFPYSQSVMEHLFMTPCFSTYFCFKSIDINLLLLNKLKSDFKVIVRCNCTQTELDF